MENLVKGSKKSKLSRSMAVSASTNQNRLHVLPSKGKWGIKIEGAEEMYRFFGSKASALKVAKEKARIQGGTLIIVHDKDGRIAATSRYE